MKKKRTIAGALRAFSGFTIQMFFTVAIVIGAFMIVIFLNIYSFYNVQFVTETYQMEIRKDVQTINKRLLFAVASNNPDVTAAQKEDLEKRFSFYVWKKCDATHSALRLVTSWATVPEIVDEFISALD